MEQLLMYNYVCYLKEKSFLINSSGGSMTSGWCIYDSLRLVDGQVKTISCGVCASIGSVILGSGTTGLRTAFGNSRIMLHQPIRNASGEAVEMEILTREYMYQRTKINR